MDLQQFINDFAEDFEDIDASQMSADSVFTDFEEWSSLTVISVIAMIHVKYKKSVTAEEVLKCNTINDLFLLVKEK